MHKDVIVNRLCYDRIKIRVSAFHNIVGTSAALPAFIGGEGDLGLEGHEAAEAEAGAEVAAEFD